MEVAGYEREGDR